MNTYSLRSRSLAIAPLTPHTTTISSLPKPHAEVFLFPLGYGVAFAKIARTVDFDGSGAVQLNHDVGFFIPHYPITFLGATVTPQLVAHIAFSKCQMMFGKATVLVEGQQAGWWHWIALFQVCANPVPLPIGLNFSFFYTTVTFGFSWGDLICGYIRVGVDMALTHIITIVFRHPHIKPMFDAWSTRLADRLYPALGPTLARIGVGRFVIGVYNYDLIFQMLRKVPSHLKKFIVGPLIGSGSLGAGWVKTPQMYPAGEAGLEILSRIIDKAFASEAPPTGLGDPGVMCLLDPIPILE